MKRQLIHNLIAWKQSKRRKPLLLMGARQVGKTTLLRHFGSQYYESLVEVNFDDRPDLKSVFSQDLDPDRIVRDLSLAFGVDILPGKTLLLFDEIQECPEALNSLKYFNEKANAYHVCAAGSLLGVKMKHAKGFPVGKVQFEHLYPMSYAEYLVFIGEERLADHLNEVGGDDKLPEVLHQKCLMHLKEYFLVGGMPEAVVAFSEARDFSVVRKIQADILQAYELDFSKHAPSNLREKIATCFHSITSQLAKENKKFVYAVVREGARARSYEDALQWLSEAGLFYKVYCVNTAKLPLAAYAHMHIFKCYLLDVGLLGAMAKITPKLILDGDALFSEFHGSFTENYVAQALVSIQRDDHLHYWASGNRAEIDFVQQYDNELYPIEVKSGLSTKKKSLHVYRDKYSPNKIVRVSPQGLDRQDGFINVPLYLMHRLHDLVVS